MRRVVFERNTHGCEAGATDGRVCAVGGEQEKKSRARRPTTTEDRSSRERRVPPGQHLSRPNTAHTVRFEKPTKQNTHTFQSRRSPFKRISSATGNQPRHADIRPPRYTHTPPRENELSVRSYNTIAAVVCIAELTIIVIIVIM